MGKFAIIETGRVVNIAEADADFATAQGWIDAGEANIGDTYADGVFTKYDPKTDPEATAGQAAAVRADRNARLASCDWTQLDDAPANKAAWASYRQALRNIPAQSGFPWEVSWPAQPK